MASTNKPRISESELIIPALKAIAQEPEGRILTATLIHKLRARLKPAGLDQAILDNRNDDRFSQKVRNLVSHKTLEKRGFVKKVYQGLQLTNQGWKIATGGTSSI